MLVILIFTITSELTFSIGGQILTPHRSRLYYTTLEVLMCSKSWLWNPENAGKILNAYVILYELLIFLKLITCYLLFYNYYL